MALFLTGMINDGARTAANGPGETSLYQTAAEGAVGGGEEGRRGRGRGEERGWWGQTEVRGSQPGPSPPPHPMPPTPIGSHCASAAEQGTSEREGGGLHRSRIYRKGFMFGEWEDLLEDGGLKLSELGSCSPSVALGSDVAITPLVPAL